MTTVEEYARGIVTDQRDPPRAVSLWPLVARSYASRAGLITLGIGLVLCLPVLVVAAFVAEGTTAERIVLVSILGAVTSVSILSAGIRALRIWRGLVKGLLATGEVLRSAWAGPSLRPETVDAQVQGLTRGTWRIVHPVLGEFDASFESDAPWASELRKGTHVSVLVEAGTRRVVLDLGPGGLHQQAWARGRRQGDGWIHVYPPMSTDPPIPREVFGTATEIGTALLVARHEGDKVSSPAAGSVHVFVCVPRQELDIGIRDPTPQRVIVTHWGTVRECGALETADPQSRPEVTC